MNLKIFTGLIFLGFCSGKPFPAAQVLVTCGHGQALVTWQSSYFGYEKQYSLVQYSTDNVKFINASDVTKEYIKEKIFQASVHNLQDSSQYFFRVFTTNTYGSSTSLPTNCSTETSQGFHTIITFVFLSRDCNYIFTSKVYVLP